MISDQAKISAKNIKRNSDKYAMMLPFFLLFIVFTVIPIVISVGISFTNYNMLQTPKFVGLSNYINLFLENSIFLKSIKNTLLFAFVTGPISYILCLLVAWLVNELGKAGRTFMTFLFYSPAISGNLYVIWRFMFSGDMYGLANGTLMSLGITNEPINWFNDPKYSLTIIIVVQLWMSLGASFLAFIAGLQSVDRSLYESGAIDGVRNRFQEFIYITIPSMGPQLLFGAVMQIAASFSAGRICIDLAGMPSTDYSASTVITEIVDYGTVRFEMGYASAIATVLFIAMLLTNQLVKKVLTKHSD